MSAGYSYFVFTLLFLLYMFDYIDRMVVASLFPYLQSDWGLSDAQCGALVSAVYWSIIAFTFPVSLLIDRWSRKKSIGMMALLWSLATASCAFTKSFIQLFTVRIAIGVGEAGYAPGGTAMISALFPEKKRAAVMGIWNASIPLGSAIGIGLGAFIAEKWGWRHAFGIVALPGFIVAIAFFFVKDYKTVDLVRTEKGAETKKRMSTKDVVREFASTPSLILTYVAFAGNTFVTTAMLVWLPTYFHRLDQMPMTEAGFKSGTVMLPAIIGAPLGGYLADRWLRKRRNARPLFAAITSMITAVIVFCAFWVAKGEMQYPVLILSGMFIVMFLPAAAAVTQDVVHPGMRATSYSFCVIVQNLLGSSLGPIFIGFLSDRYGIKAAMSTLPIFLVIASILLFSASRFYNRDMDKVEKIALELEN